MQNYISRNTPLWIVLGMAVALACSVPFTPRARGTHADEGAERFTIPGTDLEVSYQVSEEGEALFWLEDQPDLEPLTSRVISEERGALEWNGARLDGYGELDKEQSAALAELFDTPYGQAVPLIALQRACQPDSDLNAKQLAALLYAWQMHLKYSPVDRVEEARRFWDASGCADALSQPPNEMDEDTPTLIYSNAAYIPVVFGYFPFDPDGAYETESTSVKMDPPFTDIMLMAFQADEPVNQESVDVPIDQTGPCKSKCRGACGADCTTNNCEVEEITICEKDDQGKYTGFLIYADRNLCGVHQGCIDHDACYDECNAKYGCGTWRAAYCRHSGSLILGQYGCDMKARQQYGTSQCAAWARGYPGSLGTFDTYKAFDYVRQPVGVRISNPEVCKESEAIQFTIRMEMIEEPFFLEESPCEPGKTVFIMTLWNVGAAGGDEYALVDTSESRYVDYRWTEDDCTVIDYGGKPDIENAPPVHFSGGPNGTITALLEENEEILLGEFVDGKVFILDEDFWTVMGWSNYSPREFPVPDPSVFEGLE